MCRIAGLISHNYYKPEAAGIISAMCRVQSHGGPDGEGIAFYRENSVGFGHRRLSIIDLSEMGNQPMVYNSDSLSVTYNGELYNYLELRNELKGLGHMFRSNSDTEVILAAFAQWHVKSFERLQGMFAFAIYDKNQDKVFLVRDPSGIKPLYFSTLNESLVFASETKAFSHIGGVSEVNDKWPVHFLAYGHLPEPITRLKHVFPLPKGHYLEFCIDTCTSKILSYYSFKFLEVINSRDEAIQLIKESFHKAIKSHLLADAPIGSFLSGGIDSSIVTLVADEYINWLNTLSVFFGESTYSEKPYQDIVGKKLNNKHSEYLITQQDFSENLPAILQCMDQPSCDGINTWFISKFAREKGLKAVLSGLGGDELFGGYPSFDRMAKTNLLQKLPEKTLRAGRYGNFKQMRRLPFLTLEGIKGRYLFLRGQFNPIEIARHLDMQESEVWSILEEQPFLQHIGHMSSKNQASWMEMHLYMQNQLLRDSDVMSMAHGLEMRIPFLDVDFVKLVLRIRSDVKYAKAGKQLLVDAFKDILPEQVYNRKKMGFSFPFREWLKADPWVKDEMNTADKQTKKTYEQFLNNKAHWSNVISLLQVKNQTVAQEIPVSYA